jgi:hypothetical protein
MFMDLDRFCFVVSFKTQLAVELSVLEVFLVACVPIQLT